MALNKDAKVWVVFEGRRPGIYQSWPHADLQVNGYKGQLHQAYQSYDHAVAEWQNYCILRGRDKEFIKANMNIQFESGSSSNVGGGEACHNLRKLQLLCVSNIVNTDVYVKLNKNAFPILGRIAGNLAEDTSSNEFVIQQSMQKQLAAACNILGLEEPIYKLHEAKHINGVKYHRYYASLVKDCVGRPVVTVGRFGKTDDDAMEDAAAMLLRRLISASGKKIRDLNHYNVTTLEEQLQKTLDENMELEMEIYILNEEIS